MFNVRSKQRISIISPATSANFVCGFDIIGFAVEAPFDRIDLVFNQHHKIRIREITGTHSLSRCNDRNCAAFVLQLFCQKLNTRQGVDIFLHKGVPIGSGLGSSAASSMGTLYAANLLFDSPLNRKELISLAMQGEAFISGALHADNVAPCLLGGITLIPRQAPLDIIPCPLPSSLGVIIVFPEFELPTKRAREALPQSVPLQTAVKQWGNIAGLVAALFQKNLKKLGDYLSDDIIEPARASLIPGFYEVQQAALQAGAMSCSISGGGPSVVALTQHREHCLDIGDAMANAFKQTGLATRQFITRIQSRGCHEIDGEHKNVEKFR